MRILVINGPNLNLILSREKKIYGDLSIESIQQNIHTYFPEIDLTFFTTNNESDIIYKIQEVSDNYDGLIINPGAYTHVSVGIRDALEICNVPKIEVHLSNLSNREQFRNVFLTTSKCDGYISGLKDISYLTATMSLIELIKRRKYNNELK